TAARSAFLGAAVLGVGGLSACSNPTQVGAVDHRDDIPARSVAETDECAPPTSSSGEPAAAEAELPPEVLVAPRLVLDPPPDLFKNAWRRQPAEITVDFVTESERRRWEPGLAPELQKSRRDLFYNRFAVHACAEMYFDDVRLGGT